MVKIFLLIIFILNCIGFSSAYVFAQSEGAGGAEPATPTTSPDSSPGAGGAGAGKETYDACVTRMTNAEKPACDALKTQEDACKAPLAAEKQAKETECQKVYDQKIDDYMYENRESADSNAQKQANANSLASMDRNVCMIPVRQKEIDCSKFSAPCYSELEQRTAATCQQETGTQPPTPASDGSGTTPPKITTPPPIPQISTLPGPQGTNVSQANIYLQQSFLPSIALTVIRIAIPLAVVFLIFGAVQLLTAYGSDEKISVAKKTLTWALVGLIISLLSYAIVQMIFYSGYEITTM